LSALATGLAIALGTVAVLALAAAMMWALVASGEVIHGVNEPPSGGRHKD